MFRKIALLSTVLSITSCSYIYGENGVFKNRDTAYLNSHSEPPLQIPPGMSSSTFQSHYPISDRTYPISQEKVDLTPPELNTYTSPPAPVKKIAPQAQTTQANNTAPQTGKPRTLMDYFEHGGSLTNLYPNSPSKSSNTSSDETTASAATNSNSQASASHKPRTIADYFQNGGSLTNLFSGSHS